MNQQLQQTLDLAWQIGDWQALVSTDISSLDKQTNAQKYSLKIAIAHCLLGNTDKAKQFIQRAKQQGADNVLLATYLIGSVYQTLAQTQLVLQRTDLAAKSLNQAAQIQQGSTQQQPEWLTHAQLEQCTKGLKPIQKMTSIEAKTTEVLELGQAWAGNTINTVIFRHQGVFSYQGRQYTAFYVDNNILRLIKRDLKTNKFEQYDLLGEYNLKDAHNTISLGIDREGYLHMSYDHHGNRLNYRRSQQAHSIQDWSDRLPMTGIDEERVTYPAFILPTQYTPLLMLYRDGNWKQGTAYLKYFDESLRQWFDYPNSILSGAEQKPWTSNAYWNHPTMDEHGVLHISYTWRTDYFSAEQLISNVNIDYAKSYDGGFNWFTSKDQPYKLPITPTNTETVWPISPGSNHINQTSMALDSKGHPHIVFYANDLDGIPQYQHLWYDGQQWKQSYVTQRNQSFTLNGGGTLDIPISRPEIIIDSNDTVYIIYRSEETQQKLVASYQTAPDYACQPNNTMVLWDENTGQAEPIIDRARWQQEKILTILVQYNQQPDGDLKHQSISQSIKLIDIQFQKILNKVRSYDG